MSDASTVRAGESLLLGDGTQLALLEVDECGLPVEAYAKFEQAGRFTGDRLFFSNPKLYEAMVRLLARGLTYREIAEVCSVSVNTVCGVCFREGVSIETLRERIGRLGLDVAHLTLECIRDLLADPKWKLGASAKDLAIIHGISFSNAQLALGGATSRVVTADMTPPSHEAYLAMLAGTGLGAGTGGTKGVGDGRAEGEERAAIVVEARVVEPDSGASTES